jgi:hypothetical protein
MLQDWLAFKALVVPCTPVEIRKEFIWFNNFIKIEGKACFWAHWYSKGIRFINDLVDGEGNFLLQDQLTRKYGIQTNFLECLQLRSAVPYEWKQILRGPCEPVESDSVEPIVQVYGREMPLNCLSCKDVYWTLISALKEMPASQVKWIEIYPQIQVWDWSNIYSASYACSMETKLQAFNFKILHRIVQHKKLLSRMGIEESPECPFCQEDETIQHKFYSCPRSLGFWKSVSDWLSQNALNIQVSELEVIFGLPQQNKCLNYIILLGKYFIQIQYSNMRPLNCTNFQKYLTSQLRMLKCICLQNDKPHEECWEEMLIILETQEILD